MSFEDKSIQTIDIADELLHIGTYFIDKGKYRLSYRGYKKALLAEQLSSKEICLLLCSICEGILLNASSDQSGEVLCECCVSGPVSTPLLPFRKTVSELCFKCPQYFRGCKWSGLISDIREHVELCGYLYISCPQGCDESMLQQHTEEHVTHTCIERMISCDFCMKLLKAKNLTEHHGVCPMYLIECSNLCGLEVKRYQLEDHLKRDCLYRLVPCPYVKYGCDETEIRFCCLKQHMDTKKDQHLSNLEKSHQMLEQTLNLKYQLIEEKDEELELKHQGILLLEKETESLKLKHQDILRIEKENLMLKQHQDILRIEKEKGDLKLKYQADIVSVEGENKKFKQFISPTLARVCLGGLHDIRHLTIGNSTVFNLKNETFYTNLVRAENGRLFFIVQFPTQREGVCLTILLNQDNSDDSIVFQPMELNCRPMAANRFLRSFYSFFSFSSEPNYYAIISSEIEDNLLISPFVKDGKAILKIGIVFK